VIRSLNSRIFHYATLNDITQSRRLAALTRRKRRLIPFPSPPRPSRRDGREPRKIMHVHIKPFGIIIDGLLASNDESRRDALQKSYYIRERERERERERGRDACVAKGRQITLSRPLLLLAYCINVSRAFNPSSIKPRCSSERRCPASKGPLASPDAVTSSIGTLVPVTYNPRLRLI